MEKKKPGMLQMFFIIPPPIITVQLSHLPVIKNLGWNNILVAALLGAVGALIGSGVFDLVKNKNYYRNSIKRRLLWSFSFIAEN